MYGPARLGRLRLVFVLVAVTAGCDGGDKTGESPEGGVSDSGVPSASDADTSVQADARSADDASTDVDGSGEDGATPTECPGLIVESVNGEVARAEGTVFAVRFGSFLNFGRLPERRPPVSYGLALPEGDPPAPFTSTVDLSIGFAAESPEGCSHGAAAIAEVTEIDWGAGTIAGRVTATLTCVVGLCEIGCREALVVSTEFELCWSEVDL